MAGLFIALLQNAGISILQAKNLNRYRMTVYTIAAFLNLIISIPLSKSYSGLGCAISTSIALVFSTGFIMNWYYKKIIKINIYLFWKNILQMSKPLLVLFIFGTILDMLLGVYYNWIVLLAKITIYTVLYCIVMFFYGMNSYETNLCRSFIIKLKRGKIWK
jgi:O-antigen/teichoic acid export membrane protein